MITSLRTEVLIKVQSDTAVTSAIHMHEALLINFLHSIRPDGPPVTLIGIFTLNHEVRPGRCLCIQLTVFLRKRMLDQCLIRNSRNKLQDPNFKPLHLHAVNAAAMSLFFYELSPAGYLSARRFDIWYLVLICHLDFDSYPRLNHQKRVQELYKLLVFRALMRLVPDVAGPFR